jgi:hypothetical protein
MLSGLHNALNAHTLGRIFLYYYAHTRWLAYLVHVSDGWMHSSLTLPFLQPEMQFQLGICEHAIECDARKRVAALENCFETLSGLFLLSADQVISGASA